ncbi:hypothetical protein MHU86_23708 [Fragilaria crotonensis]|nr:hypothetical protein MHU86_23708 [Fragilaria crotonensis]
MENRGIADHVDVVAKGSSGYDIDKDDFAEELSCDLPSISMSSGASGCSLYASMQLPPASKQVYKDDGRDVAYVGSVSGQKKLEHAQPGETMHVPRLGMEDSLEWPPVVAARIPHNHNVPPGAFPVRSSRNTPTSRTLRSPSNLYASTREFVNEESKQEEGVANPARAYSGANDSSRMDTGSGLYAVEARRVHDGSEDGTVMVAEAQYVRMMKWYRLRWISVGLAFFVCCLVFAVIILAMIFVRSPSAASSSSLTPPTSVPMTGAPPTSDPMTKAPSTLKPSTLTSEQIACNFLSISDMTECRSKVKFDPYNTGDTTNGSTIPSEIGLLTQLRYLSFYSKSLTSTIPSEIGLLTQLTYLHFGSNLLNSIIPSEIGLLTQLAGLWFFDNRLTSIPRAIGQLTRLTALDFQDNALNSTIQSEIGLLTNLRVLILSDNELKGTIPSSLCSLPSLNGSIYIDCGEITCTSGCCVDYYSRSSCG